jgi:molybdopterin molybdotransferase
MLSVEEAKEKIRSLTSPLSQEWTSVESAIGRAVAQPTVAMRTLPPWDNSAMDGYALRSADTSGAPVRLRVEETIFAGHLPTRTIGKGQCSRIMTGAPMPQGADAVVMQEKVRITSESSEVEILEAALPRSCVRDRGEDAREGDVLLPQHASLGIPEAALLWAQGILQVPVPRRPQVAILATGDELCRPDEEPNGRIVDTNSPSLAAAILRLGGLPRQLGIAKDNLEEISKRLREATTADVVLICSGASVGERDFARKALEAIGAQIHFWRVAIKPGKPIAVASLGQTLIFALPGNPTSSLVCFELFVRPALRRMMGHQEPDPAPVPARSEVSLEKKAGLTHFVRVSAHWDRNDLWATPLASQTSGAIRSAASATHLLIFPAPATRLNAGDSVQLLPLSWVG